MILWSNIGSGFDGYSELYYSSYEYVGGSESGFAFEGCQPVKPVFWCFKCG